MSSILRAPQLLTEKRLLETQRPVPVASLRPAAEDNNIARTAELDGQARYQKQLEQDVAHRIEEMRVQLLAEAAKEIAVLRETARQEGLREGREHGEAGVRRMAEATAQRVNALVERIGSSLAQGARDADDLMVEIVFEAVCKIIGDAALGVDGIRACVSQAATHVVDGSSLAVRLHPADLEVLRASINPDAALLPSAGVSWKADERIELGGCVLETDGGELDARLETQLGRLRAVLLEARRRRY